MVKGVKVLVVVATAMIAAGMILLSIGFALGGFNSVQLGSQGFYVEDWDTVSNVRENSSRSVDSFTGVEVKVAVHSVELRAGAGYGVRIRNSDAREAPEIRVADGVLTVSGRLDASRGAGRRVFRYNWLPRIFGAIDDIGDRGGFPAIEITYPAGARLDGVTIEAAAGNVELDGLEAASLSVDCAAGGLKMEDVNIGDFKLDLGAGGCEIDNVRAEIADVTVDVGGFSASDFDCGHITGNFRMGSVDIEGRLGDVDIYANMGSVELETDRPRSEYRLDLDVTLGKATVNGRPAGSEYGGPDSAPYTIRVEADMGAVELDFEDFD